MPVFRSEAELLGEQGRPIARGKVYLHLPRGLSAPQTSSGTMSLQAWDPAAGQPDAIRLPDGRVLGIQLERDALSDCSRSRVLRFTTAWPGASR